MINNILVSYDTAFDGITYQMNCNLGHDAASKIATMTSNIMENTMVNPMNVIEQLIKEFCPDYILTEKEDKK